MTGTFFNPACNRMPERSCKRFCRIYFYLNPELNHTRKNIVLVIGLKCQQFQVMDTSLRHFFCSERGNLIPFISCFESSFFGISIWTYCKAIKKVLQCLLLVIFRLAYLFSLYEIALLKFFKKSVLLCVYRSPICCRFDAAIR